MDSNEVWKDIKGYEGIFKISSHGRVYSVRSQKILKTSVKKHGYVQVNLWVGGQYKSFRVHRLVAQAFLDNPNNYEQVNHIDGVKTNNHVDNLEWVSASQNRKHAIQTGLQSFRGTKNNKSKLTDEQVLAIYTDKRPIKEISETYNIAESQVSQIRNGKAWKHITQKVGD